MTDISHEPSENVFEQNVLLSVLHGKITPDHQCYLCFVGLEFWKDLWVNHVQLGLNLVTSDVVVCTDLFIKDQVLCCGWEPIETQRQLSASVCQTVKPPPKKQNKNNEPESLWSLVSKWEKSDLSIHSLY